MLFVTAQQDDIHLFWHLFLLCHHWTRIPQTIQFEWVIEKRESNLSFTPKSNARPNSIPTSMDIQVSSLCTCSQHKSFVKTCAGVSAFLRYQAPFKQLL